jgi:hypothetical protein
LPEIADGQYNSQRYFIPSERTDRHGLQRFHVGRFKEKLQLTVDAEHNLFSTAGEVAASARLVQALEDMLPLALAIGTEKARSEMIITPVLVELRKHAKRKVSLFSGVNFNVAPALGMTGVCDFIISRSPEQLTLSAPALIVVEAKNENINAGLPQCIATMFAARMFNERAKTNIHTIYGAVTTGNNWRFLKLEANIAYIDLREYYISQVEKILGILASVLESDGSPATRNAT